MATGPCVQLLAYSNEPGEMTWPPYGGTGAPPSDPTCYDSLESAAQGRIQDIENSGDEWPADQCRALDASTGQVYEWSDETNYWVEIPGPFDPLMVNPS